MGDVRISIGRVGESKVLPRGDLAKVELSQSLQDVDDTWSYRSYTRNWINHTNYLANSYWNQLVNKQIVLEIKTLSQNSNCTLITLTIKKLLFGNDSTTLCLSVELF